MTNLDEICLKILGTQSPFCKEDAACPSYYIKYKDTKILLDCGSGSHRFFDFNQISGLNIFISHLHHDHYNDLFNYMYTAYSLKRQKKIDKSINIYIPTYPSDAYAKIKAENLTCSEIFDIDEYKKYNLADDIVIDFCRLEHTNYVENFAIRVKICEKTIVYTGDLSYSAKNNIVNFAKNADILICESSLLKAHNFPEICVHLTAHQAATIAKEANVKKLILTHFWPEEKMEKYLQEAKQVFQNSYAAKEKDIYKL